MKTFGLKLKRHEAFPPTRVEAITDNLEELPELPSITKYIENLIDESPEVLKAYPHEDEDKKSDITHTLPPDPGMIFISQPSQVMITICGCAVIPYF